MIWYDMIYDFLYFWQYWGRNTPRPLKHIFGEHLYIGCAAIIFSAHKVGLPKFTQVIVTLQS